VDGGEKALLDAEPLVHDLGDGGEAVCGATRVRDHVVLSRIVHLIVDAEHDRDVLVLRGSRDDDLLDSVAAVSNRLGGIGEEASGLDHDVDARLSQAIAPGSRSAKTLIGLPLTWMASPSESTVPLKVRTWSRT